MLPLQRILLSQLARPFPALTISSRSIVKVGDKVPVTYLKDEKPPVIKEDSAYPFWLNTIAEPAPSKAKLQELFEQQGITGLSVYEASRLKRLINKEKINKRNASSGESEE